MYNEVVLKIKQLKKKMFFCEIYVKFQQSHIVCSTSSNIRPQDPCI